MITKGWPTSWIWTTVPALPWLGDPDSLPSATILETQPPREGPHTCSGGSGLEEVRSQGWEGEGDPSP